MWWSNNDSNSKVDFYFVWTDIVMVLELIKVLSGQQQQ